MINIEEIFKKIMVVELYCIYHVWVRVPGARNLFKITY